MFHGYSWLSKTRQNTRLWGGFFLCFCMAIENFRVNRCVKVGIGCVKADIRRVNAAGDEVGGKPVDGAFLIVNGDVAIYFGGNIDVGMTHEPGSVQERNPLPC